ncbi:stalk domain-containing protein, partial [Paenibacillus polymyxa]
MKRKIPTFLFGLGVGILVTTSVSVGASNFVKATLLNTKVIVNGTEAKLNDQPISVNGRSYLPVRDTASAMGYSVKSASSSKIELVEGGTNTPSSTSTSTTTQTTKAEPATTAVKQGGKTFNVEQYAKGDKLDSEKIAAAIASGELTINSQDANGDSILHWVIRKNDYATYLVIKKNGLNVNVKNRSFGDTPLHEAVKDENGFFLGELKDLKATPTIKNAEGKLPIDYAKANST